MDDKLPPDQDLSPIAQALLQGNKFEAIRLYREAHGGSLKESKDAVEQLESALRAQFPERFSRAGCLGCLVLLLLAGLGFGPPSGGFDPATKDPATNAGPAQLDADKVIKSPSEWKKQLTKQQYRITRLKETEPAFSGKYWNSKKDGIYRCVCCGQPLFDSRAKFDSGTGWPSFWQPLAENVLAYENDFQQPELRIEVLCRRCDAHLGHVFADGPPPTGLRYCINSAALRHEDRSRISPTP